MTQTAHGIERRRRALLARMVLSVGAALVASAAGLMIAVTASALGGSVLIVTGLLATVAVARDLPRLRRLRREVAVLEAIRGEQRRARRAQRQAMALAFGGTLRAAPSTSH